jgi:hypothetical protein
MTSRSSTRTRRSRWEDWLHLVSNDSFSTPLNTKVFLYSFALQSQYIKIKQFTTPTTNFVWNLCVNFLVILPHFDETFYKNNLQVLLSTAVPTCIVFNTFSSFTYFRVSFTMFN